MFFIVQLECNDLCTPNTRQDVFQCEMKNQIETLMEHHLHIKDVFILEQFVRRTSKCVNVQTYKILRTILNKILKAMLDAEGNTCMTFWQLRLMNNPLDFLEIDRVTYQKNLQKIATGNISCHTVDNEPVIIWYQFKALVMPS